VLYCTCNVGVAALLQPAVRRLDLCGAGIRLQPQELIVIIPMLRDERFGGRLGGGRGGGSGGGGEGD